MDRRVIGRSGPAFVIGLLLIPGVVVAQSQTPEEAQLQAEQQAIDNEAAPAKDAARAEALASQFQVPASAVQDLRGQQQGWGEITIRLAMAQELSKTDPATYPTMADALSHVDALRSDGKGWGQMAHELGFQLGPVMREVKRVRPEIPLATEGGRPERAGRPVGGERPEHPQRPERLHQPPGHSGR